MQSGKIKSPVLLKKMGVKIAESAILTHRLVGGINCECELLNGCYCTGRSCC